MRRFHLLSRFAACAALLAFAVLFNAMRLRAQSAIASGAISGIVLDTSGAAVPGAQITATNVSTGLVLHTKTNNTGFYSFPSLTTGEYQLVVEHAGFKTTQINHVVVQVGQTVAGNATLQVGAVSQTVTVTGQTPLLRATEATVGSVVNTTLVSNLPLSGRRYTDFVLLTPNANSDGQFGLVSIGGQQGGGDSGYANGNGANSYTVDGSNFTGTYSGGARGRTRVPYIYGEQSIKEFQVSDNPYNAAYGGAGSGFVNTVTKSGTDEFHGNAFYYNRNSGVGNANDAVDKGAGLPRPLDVLQQFGADLGGPIQRKKAWFYFDYEQQRRKFPISVVNPGYPVNGPSAFNETNFGVPAGTALPSSNGPYPVPASFVPPSPFSYSALSASEQTEYLQEVSNALNAITRNLGQRARRADDLSFFPKVDWQLDSADHLTFSYNYNRFNSPGGEITFNPVSFAGDEALSNNYVRDHQGVVHWTHTFSPSLLNDFDAAFSRDEQIETPSGLTSASLGTIEIFSPGFLELGNPGFSSGDTKASEFQVNERVTYILGRHTLNVGFDYDRTHVGDFFAGGVSGHLRVWKSDEFCSGQIRVFQSVGWESELPVQFSVLWLLRAG